MVTLTDIIPDAVAVVILGVLVCLMGLILKRFLMWKNVKRKAGQIVTVKYVNGTVKRFRIKKKGSIRMLTCRLCIETNRRAEYNGCTLRGAINITPLECLTFPADCYLNPID